MKSLASAITLIVFVFSVVAIYSAVSDMLGDHGQFVLLRFLLSVVGITAFVTLMLKKKIFILFDIIWFLPQVAVLYERFVDPLYDAYAERTIYDLTLSISSILVIGIEKAPDVFLRIGFNLVAIAGLVLSIIGAVGIFKSKEDSIQVDQGGHKA